MLRWTRCFARELADHVRHGWDVLSGARSDHPREVRLVSRLAVLAGGIVVLLFAVFAARAPALRVLPPQTRIPQYPPAPEPVDYTKPVRELPDRFRANTYLPPKGEGRASVSIAGVAFDANLDLVGLYDDRVWWESDHDSGDTEDDHRIHWAMETPFRRLIELVVAEDGVLEVHDAYRDEGIHASKSLHRQGRALDLTCDELGLERLAKLCWASGFDWVYYEAPKGGGHHIHVSVRP